MVKKKTVKKSASSKKSSTALYTPEVVSQASSLKATTPQQRKRMYVIFVVAALVILLLFAMKGYLVAAMVNGQPISRLKVVSQLEKQGGKQILDSLVTNSLILQEAEKRGVTLTQDDINKDIALIEANAKKQGQTLDQLLKMYNITKDEVIEQRKPDLLLGKMVGTDVKVSDKEVDDFITKNNEAYGGTLTPAQVKEELVAQKLKEKKDALVAKLQKNAKVDYFVNY